MAALDNPQPPNEPTDDQKRAARRQALLDETKPFWWAMLGMIGISLLLALLWHAKGAKEGTSWLYITLGLGCLSAGSLIGFLFGIPNTGQAKRDLSIRASADTSTTADRPSTNLEQVSDWLTKIIIGVSLVEWSRITAALGRLGELVQ